MTCCCPEVRGIRIVGSGVAFPVDLSGSVGTEWDNPSFFEWWFPGHVDQELLKRGWTANEPWTRYGVRCRQWLTGSSAHVGDLAVEAARRALDAAGLTPGDVDLLVTATSTPARITSSLAGYVTAQCRMQTAAFDIRAGGTAALFAWITAVQFLRCNFRTALIVAAETPSRFSNRDAPLEAALLGDGAGAIVLQQCETTGGFLGGMMETLPATGKPWTVPGSLPPTLSEVQTRAYEFQASDPEYNQRLRELRVQTMAEFQALQPVIAAQARHFLSNAPTQRQTQIERDVLKNDHVTTSSSLMQHGFLGCAGPLVALHELRTSGALSPADMIVATSVGGGVHRSWLAWQV